MNTNRSKTALKLSIVKEIDKKRKTSKLFPDYFITITLFLCTYHFDRRETYYQNGVILIK